MVDCNAVSGWWAGIRDIAHRAQVHENRARILVALADSAGEAAREAVAAGARADLLRRASVVGSAATRKVVRETDSVEAVVSIRVRVVGGSEAAAVGNRSCSH